MSAYKVSSEKPLDYKLSVMKGIAGRPKMTWRQLTEGDCRERKLSAIDPHDRDTWRSGVISAMHASSQLPGRGSTDEDIAPVPAC